MLEEINIKESIDLYKNNISLKNHTENDYINLILLFWNISFDYGLESYCITEKIFTENEISNFSKEIEILFDKAFNEYPDNKELQFWKLHIDDLSTYCECSHKEDMYNLLRIEDFHLPYFYLYVQCDVLNIQELKQLKIILLQEDDSYKKAYILSYLDDIEI